MSIVSQVNWVVFDLEYVGEINGFSTAKMVFIFKDISR
jgi:hypothetical protein